MRYALRAAPALAMIAMCLAGCRGSAGPTSPAARVVQSVPAKTADGKGVVHRYTVDQFAAMRTAARAPYVVPAESMLVIVRSGGSSGSPDGPRPMRKENGKLYVLENAGVPTVTAMLGLGIRSEDYNELRIRMRVNRGETCTVTWTTDLEPSSVRSDGLTVPIFADNEMHTYRLSLNGLTVQSWVGLVKSLVLRPSNVPADVEIESMELDFVPPEDPARITIGAQTHEAAFGTLSPWELVLPANAAFGVYIGLPDYTWADDQAASARFVATMDTDAQKGVLLIDQTLAPSANEAHRGWIPFKADLSNFAGQRARFHFTVSGADGRTLPSPAYWGDPRVYATEKESTAPPVILISCDTLRADHLSCYGYARETTPHLDALAKDGVLFENAIAVETWTLPSHATMFTGLYPKHHGVTANANLAESTLTLPEALRGAGYLNAGFTGFTFWLFPWRGFAHGFDVYNTPDWRFRNIHDTLRFAENWLGANPVPNFFLFLHNFDVHSKPAKQFDGLPYGPEDAQYLHFTKEFSNPPTFERPGRDIVDAEAFLNAANAGQLTVTPEEVEYCKALYDDALRMVDMSLGSLFDKLKQDGLYENALIVVLADHGEEFGEHGTFGHGNVYEPALHIPMIMKFPRGQFAGTRFAPVVEQVDVMPTVLDVAGAPIPEGIDGKSLFRVLKNEEGPRTVGFGQRFAAKTAREAEWKLIRTRPDTYELYNVKQDPGEKTDLAAAQPDQVARLRGPLEEFFKVNPQGWHIAYDVGNTDSKSTVTISTEDIIESAELTGGKDVATMTQTDRSVTLYVGKNERVGRDELVVRTIGTTGRISLSIKSSDDFTVALGDQPPATGSAFRVVLDPNTKEYPQPPVAQNSSGAHFRIWYVPQTGTRSAAQHLSPEAQQELRDLGYVGE